MGERFNWTCPAQGCGGVVKDVSGGWDRGFFVQTETRICHSCRYVRDYAIGVVSDPGHPHIPREIAEATDSDPRCAKCGGQTMAWDRTCPECGTAMRRSAHSTILWD